MDETNEALLEICKAVLVQNAELTQQVVDLAKEALRSNVPPPVPNVPIEVSRVPGFMNETEEDLEFAFKNGLISPEVYTDRIKELEFGRDEMIVPSGD